MTPDNDYTDLPTGVRIKALVFFCVALAFFVGILISCESLPQQPAPKPCTPDTVYVYSTIPAVIEKMDSLQGVIALLQFSHAFSDSVHQQEIKDLKTANLRHIETNNDLNALYRAQIEDGEKYQSRLKDCATAKQKALNEIIRLVAVNDSLRRTRINVVKP